MTESWGINYLYRPPFLGDLDWISQPTSVWRKLLLCQRENTWAISRQDPGLVIQWHLKECRCCSITWPPFPLSCQSFAGRRWNHTEKKLQWRSASALLVRDETAVHCGSVVNLHRCHPSTSQLRAAASCVVLFVVTSPLYLSLCELYSFTPPPPPVSFCLGLLLSSHFFDKWHPWLLAPVQAVIDDAFTDDPSHRFSSCSPPHFLCYSHLWYSFFPPVLQFYVPPDPKPALQLQNIVFLFIGLSTRSRTATAPVSLIKPRSKKKKSRGIDCSGSGSKML